MDIETSPSTENGQTFPIRELVRRTGVNASTLRAWENRHGLLKPIRTPSGHRLYGQNDILRIRRAQELLEQGFSLHEVVQALDSEIVVTPEIAATKIDTPTGVSIWPAYISDILRGLEDFSTERLDAVYNEACAIYSIDVVTCNLLIPTLEQLGQRWDIRPSGIAEEHFFSAWLRNKLGARLHHAAGMTKGRPLIMACLAREHHEIGLLIFALTALQMGFRIIYLGANMPTRQIVHVAKKTHAAGIILAGRDLHDPAEPLADIAWLVNAVEMPVFVGSHFSVQNREALNQFGAIPLGAHMGISLRVIETNLAHAKKQAR